MDKDVIEFNSNLCNELITMSRSIQDELNENILRDGYKYIICEGGEWFREVITLLVKQSNLFESCILLLESNMEEEAYIIARSQFNNMLWISYLCNHDNDDGYKEHFYQQHIDQLKLLENIKKYVKELHENELHNDTSDFKDFNNINVSSIEYKIKEIKRILNDEGYGSKYKPKSIFSLANNDSIMEGFYLSFYNESSQYEHSNISIMNKRREPFQDDVSSDVAFILNVNKSDIELWKKVFLYSLHTLFYSLECVLDKIQYGNHKVIIDNELEEKYVCNLILSLKEVMDKLQLLKNA